MASVYTEKGALGAIIERMKRIEYIMERFVDEFKIMGKEEFYPRFLEIVADYYQLNKRFKKFQRRFDATENSRRLDPDHDPSIQNYHEEHNALTKHTNELTETIQKLIDDFTAFRKARIESNKRLSETSPILGNKRNTDDDNDDQPPPQKSKSAAATIIGSGHKSVQQKHNPRMSKCPSTPRI